MKKKNLEMKRCTMGCELSLVERVVNKFLALAVLVLCFTACKEPADETPAQVYFPKDNGSKVEIAIDAKSFDVAVNRVAAEGSARVPVTVTADSLAGVWFELPTEVEFADAALSAVYTVKVKDGAVLEYDKYAKISLAIGSEYAAALGDAVYSFEVGVPAPWSEWEKVGEGTYYPTVYWSGEQTGLEVYYRECLGNETDAQYCIRGIQNTMNLTVEYNRLSGACQVLPQYAATNYKYGQVTVADVLHSPVEVVRDADEESPCTYDAANGLFAFNLAYVVSTEWGGNADESFGSGVERFQLDGYVDPDYSFSMQFRGHYIDANGVDNAIISVSKGTDLVWYMMSVVDADEDTDVAVHGMLAGNVACDTLTAGGFYAFPMTASGNYKAVAIAYNAEGEIVEPHTVEFEFWVAADSNPWQSLGYALYTDDVVAPFLGKSVSSHYVKVVENKYQPGLYRLIDPYGPQSSLYPDASSYDTGSYIEIDATDPQGVWIAGVQSTGLDFGDGLIGITSMAWYKADALGATKEVVKEAGLCGVYADGVITFPVDGLFVVIGGNAYYGNRSGGFALDMTDLLESVPEEEGGSAAPAARVNMELKAQVVGKVSLFKKIDNSFIAPIAF